MTYPTNIPDWRTLLLQYAPAEDHEAAIYDAQAQRSVVSQAVETFHALKDAELSQDGVALLLGAAHLIASGGWHGLAGEAATVLAQRGGEVLQG